MNPIQLFDAASSTYTYILFDEATREAVIIDPVDGQLERDMAVLQQLSLQLKWALETHAHADHITSAARLAELTGARTAAPAGCEVGTAAVQLDEGSTVPFGHEQLRVLHTPGHTAGSVCYHWMRAPQASRASVPSPSSKDVVAEMEHAMRPGRRHDAQHVFTGDTLLIQGCGRTDFQSGDAGQLYDSITQKLFTLPDTTIVWPGHDYQGRTQSTMGVEKATNPRLANRSRTQFIELMNALHLPKPRRIDEAVPANRRSGLRQDADAPAASTDAAPQSAEGYAGDVTPHTAFDWMQQGRAVLVDVRTDAERAWVGFVPGATAAAWKQWPGMALNPEFDTQVQVAAANGLPLLMLCRSGVRSVAAARRATELGLTAYNVLGGFEGDPDDHAQRGHQNGWRHAGLPWRQN
ncbi:MBL fold metallo-hydrolase [Ottowia sp.]|uniref:MBL fold metallo-hydrolase n=1 Tax=Ottowia sp. TaxID=1898956 RepID=UPI003A89D6CE